MPLIKRWFLPVTVLALLLAVTTIFVWQAPIERTLGAGIKIVYVHVALTGVGSLGLLLVGALGLIGIVWGNERLVSWLRTLYQAAFICYLAGFLLAIWASYVNWGGVPLREPRFLTAINVIVVSAVCGLLLHWLPQPRLASLAAALMLSLTFISGRSERIALHPDDPISTAPESIQNAFTGAFWLALMFGLWWVWVLRRRKAPGD